MSKLIFTFAAFSGMLAVIFGAFGSHALRGRLDERLQHAFETAVSYQMTHSGVLLVVCLLSAYWGKHWALTASSVAFVTGILLFSGSLYLLVLSGMKWIGPVTPIGGVALIVGWALLGIGIWQNAEL